jgi:hypothetical protein
MSLGFVCGFFAGSFRSGLGVFANPSAECHNEYRAYSTSEAEVYTDVMELQQIHR